MTVLTPDDARAHLNIQQTGKYDDTFVQSYIDAAVAYVEERVGPLEPRSFTEQIYTGSGSCLVLNHLPVVSLTSITGRSGSTDITGAVGLPSYSGVVRWESRSPLAASTSYTVTYTAGRTSIPADLLLAVKETLRHLFRAQRSGTKRPAADQPPPTPGPSAQTLVDQLLTPHMLPGFA